MSKERLEIISQLAEICAKSPHELDQIKGRSMIAFSQVISWWCDEVAKTEDSDDPALSLALVGSVFVFQVGAILNAVFGDQPAEVRRAVFANLIGSLQREGEDIIPDPDEIVLDDEVPDVLN